MESALNILERLALRVSRFISNLSGIAVLWIIAITCVDVVGRYFFNSPLYAGSEMVQVSMAFVIFLSLPGLFFKNENIIVDFSDYATDPEGSPIVVSTDRDYAGLRIEVVDSVALIDPHENWNGAELLYFQPRPKAT